MKRTILVMMLLALMPLSVLGASEPTLINTFEVDNQSLLFTSSGNPYYRTDMPNAYDKDSTHYYAPTDTQNTNNILNVEVWDSYLAIATWERNPTFNGQWLLEIYNYETGNIIYETAIPNQASCGTSAQSAGDNSNQLMYDGAGNLVISLSYNCGGNYIRQNTIYDVSNVGFISQRNQTAYPLPFGTYATTVKDSFIVSTNGQTVEYYDGGWAYKMSATENMTTLGSHTSSVSPEIYPVDLFDRENNVFVAGNTQSGAYEDFYMVDGSTQDWNDYNNAPIYIGSVSAGVGEIQDWNRNFLNPEYITSNGNLMIVGGSDYDNFQTSSATLSFTPKFFFERDNIIGVENNKWVYADMTDLTAITEGIGTANIDADQFWRFEDNLIVTYNRTNFEFKIYEVPLPSFADEADPEANTAPTKSLDLVGVDNNGRFIFTAEFNDAQGGLVYEALSVGTTQQQLNNSFIRDIVSHNKNPSQITSSCPSETYEFSSLIRDQRVLEFPTVQDMGTYGDFCSLRHDHTTITGSDTNQLYIYGDLAITSDDAGGSTETSSIYLMTEDNDVLTAVGFDVDMFITGNNNISVYELGGSYFNLLLDEEPLNDWEHTILSYEFTIDFENKEVLFSLWEYSNYDQATTSKDYLVSNVTLPFRELTSNDFSGIIYNPVTTKHISAIGGSTAQYDNVLEAFPEYEIVGNLDAGETEILILRSEGNHDYGVYNAKLYSTDSILGLNYYENPYELVFPYDEQTEQLSEEQIAQALSNALAGANDGFNVLGTVEGDLVTDTLFGWFEDWNILSTASKFFAGLVIIMGLIALGGWLGSAVNSSIVGGIGALFGGIGGLFMVTYWGLFPAWVSFVITLIVFVIIASMMRNALTGRGG